MLKLSELQACLSNPLYRIYLDRDVVEDITVRDGKVEELQRCQEYLTTLQNLDCQ